MREIITISEGLATFKATFRYVPIKVNKAALKYDPQYNSLPKLTQVDQNVTHPALVLYLSDKRLNKTRSLKESVSSVSLIEKEFQLVLLKIRKTFWFFPTDFFVHLAALFHEL